MAGMSWDFEWQRGREYDAVDGAHILEMKEWTPPSWADRRTYVLRHPKLLDGEWQRMPGVGSQMSVSDKGKRLRFKTLDALADDKNQAIKQAGDACDKVRPLDLRPTLYADFAKLDGSPQACLKFARSWGLLFTPAKAGAEEHLMYWQMAIREVQSWMFALDLDSLEPRPVNLDLQITMVGLSLIPTGAGRPSLVLRPKTLLDGMLVQLAKVASSGGGLRECKQCGDYFETGVDNKRNDAKFCGDQCRNRFNYERRAK